jgi:hypothetical protein
MILLILRPILISEIIMFLNRFQIVLFYFIIKLKNLRYLDYNINKKHFYKAVYSLIGDFLVKKSLLVCYA